MSPRLEEDPPGGPGRREQLPVGDGASGRLAPISGPSQPRHTAALQALKLPDEGLPADKEEEAAKAEGAQPATGDGSPAAPPLPPGALAEELEAARDLQRLHVRERRKDLRSCRGCLRSAGAMEQQLEALRDRLARAEAQVGLPPPRRRRPPKDDEEEEQAEEEEGAEPGRDGAAGEREGAASAGGP